MVQGLRFHTFTAVGLGSIPGQGTKIPQAIQPSQKIKDKGMRNTKLMRVVVTTGQSGRAPGKGFKRAFMICIMSCF